MVRQLSVFQFSDGASVAEAIAGTVRAAMTDEMVLCGALVRPPLTAGDARARARAIARIEFSTGRMTITLPEDAALRRRSPRCVQLLPRGTDLIVMGGISCALYAEACKQIEAAGGVSVRVRPEHLRPCDHEHGG